MVTETAQINLKIADWLRVCRERSRLTTAESSKKSGLPEKHIVFWENGSPIPLYALLLLLISYQIPSTVTGGKLKLWQEELESVNDK